MSDKGFAGLGCAALFVYVLLVAALWGGIIYVALHFILKAW